MKVKKNFGDLEKVQKELEYLKRHAVRIGILSDTEKNDKGVIILDYALANEYGTSTIPSRPFFRTAITEHKDDIIVRMKENILSVHKNKMTGKQALDNLGIVVKGYIQYSLKKGKWKANSPRTLAVKGNKSPLIDTGFLYKAINYEIIEV